MRCPSCGAETYVFDSRPLKAGEVVRRRRWCTGRPKHKFTTYEVPMGGMRPIPNVSPLREGVPRV